MRPQGSRQCPTADDLGVSAKEKAEYINSFLADQCSAPPSSAEPAATVSRNESFELKELSASVVCKCLSTLNLRKASGLDGISQRLLKDCASSLAESVCNIFNLSLWKGVSPLVEIGSYPTCPET